MKPEARGALTAKSAPVRKRRLQQNIASEHVGLNKVFGPIDRAVDMTFRRKMHDRIRLELPEQVGHAGLVANVRAHEMKTRMPRDSGKRGHRAGIGQLVDDEDLMSGFA